jgi:hypothetical protein
MPTHAASATVQMPVATFAPVADGNWGVHAIIRKKMFV